MNSEIISVGNRVSENQRDANDRMDSLVYDLTKLIDSKFDTLASQINKIED